MRMLDHIQRRAAEEGSTKLAKEATSTMQTISARYKSPGQVAYEEDVRRKPRYDCGRRRADWSEIGSTAQSSWEKNPTPRKWGR